MTKRLGWLTGVLTVICLSAEAAHAQLPLVLDAGWTFDSFEFGTLPVPSENSLDPGPVDYDFTLTDPAILTVTDCCQLGDEFDVLDGTSVLASSALLDGEAFGDGLGFNPGTFDAALDNPDYHGVQIELAPGAYQLRLELTTLGGGFPVSIGLRLDSVPTVPTLGPAGWTALLVALLVSALAAHGRRRRSTG